MPAPSAIDLNADLGEGFAGDAQLLAHVSSASIACGGHAGDDATMRAACTAAAARGVRIGAHVSYVDRDGFGRRELGLDARAIGQLAQTQIAALRERADAVGAAIAFVKPHGALYHRAAADADVAAAIAAAARAAGIGAVLGPPGSALLAAAVDAGLACAAEGFADRGYAADATLVARDRPGALLAPGDAASQALALARHEPIRAVDGTALRLDVASLCLHGDAPDAHLTVAAVAHALAGAGIAIAPFA